MKIVFKRFRAVGMRHEGKSYSEIQKVTKVPKSTLSYWLSDLRLKEPALAIIRERKAEANRKARQKAMEQAKWRQVYNN